MWHSTPIPWVVHCFLPWLVLLSAFAVAERLPVDVVSKSTSLIEGIEKSSSMLQKRDNGTFLLRIMPLGASITLGYGSTDHNGYRKPLRQQLRYAGWQVNMIGSLRNGTMHDNEHDGHFGYRIDQLEDKIQNTILQKPNLILINAGTNDAIQNHSITTVGMRMNTLLDTLYTTIPNTTIILSTLLPNKKQPDRVQQISTQYRDLVSLRRAQNDRIVLADMSTFIKESQLVDDTHPDDAGYREMAAVWWAAIQEAEKEGFIEYAANSGTDGRVSKSVEGELDGGDSVSDPGLPAYTVPAAVQTGAAAAAAAQAGAVKATGGGRGRDGMRGGGLLVFAVGVGLSVLAW